MKILSEIHPRYSIRPILLNSILNLHNRYLSSINKHRIQQCHLTLPDKWKLLINYYKIKDLNLNRFHSHLIQPDKWKLLINCWQIKD